MIQLTDQQKAEYFHRSYTAVDGLWFMKFEERHGFDAALEADIAVWEVMPKIQARKLKELTGQSAGMAGLRACFTTKLTIEGYKYAEQAADGGFDVTVTECPWVNLLVKSGRGHLAGTIGNRICTAEYGVWAREFGEGITVDFCDRLCDGCRDCVVKFRAK